MVFLVDKQDATYMSMLSGCELIDTEKYQRAELEYEAWWRVSEANQSQTSYSVEQADIFQYQSYSHSDHMFIKHKHGYIYICIFAGKIA